MAVAQGDAEFQSKLDDRSRKRARDELNELNDKDRELAVQALRQWSLDQKWLRTPTDFDFLLRFLRAKKFSQLLARESLENYWTSKSTVTDWFRDVDPADPVILEMLRTGMIFSPKAYDKEGRRVLISAFGKLDIDSMKKKWGVHYIFKTMCLVIDWLNTDETVQVNGLLIFDDESDIALTSAMSLWNTDNIKNFMQYFYNALPGRVKAVHLYKETAIFDVVFALVAPFLKQKQKDRIHPHGHSMVKIYKCIDQELLPQEYLPDEYKGKTVGTTSSIVEEMIADMLRPEFRSYIKDLSSDRYGVDLKAKAKEKDVPVASFRKLNVD